MRGEDGDRENEEMGEAGWERKGGRGRWRWREREGVRER